MKVITISLLLLGSCVVLHAQSELVREQLTRAPFGRAWTACTAVNESELLIASDEGQCVLYNYQARTLHGISLPEMAILRSVAVADNGTWFLGDAQGFVWTTSDRGITWRKTRFGPTSIMRLLRASTEIVAVLVNGDIVGGVEKLQPEVRAHIDGATLYNADDSFGIFTLVGTRGFFAVSTNAGRTWVEKSTKDTVHLTCAYRTAADTLFLGGMKSTIYVSHNGGDDFVHRSSVVKYIEPDTGQYKTSEPTWAIIRDGAGRLVLCHEYYRLGINSGEGFCRYVWSADGGASWRVELLDDRDTSGVSWWGLPLKIAQPLPNGSIMLMGVQPTSAPSTMAVYRMDATDDKPRIDSLVQSTGSSVRFGNFGTVSTITYGHLSRGSGNTIWGMRVQKASFDVYSREVVSTTDTCRSYTIHHPLPADVIQLQSAHDTLFVLTDSAVIRRSTDSGATWVEIWREERNPEFFLRAKKMYPLGGQRFAVEIQHGDFAPSSGRYKSDIRLVRDGRAKSVPVPFDTDSIGTMGCWQENDSAIWYFVIKRVPESGIQNVYLCMYNTVSDTKQQWMLPAHLYQRGRWAASFVVHSVHGNRVIFGYTSDTTLRGTTTLLPRVLWFDVQDGTCANIIELESRIQRNQDALVDVVEIRGTLVALRYSVIHSSVNGGVTWTDIPMVGSPYSSLDGRVLSSPLQFGDSYILAGGDESVFRIREKDITSSVTNQAHVSGAQTCLMVHPNPVTPGTTHVSVPFQSVLPLKILAVSTEGTQHALSAENTSEGATIDVRSLPSGRYTIVMHATEPIECIEPLVVIR